MIRCTRLLSVAALASDVHEMSVNTYQTLRDIALLTPTFVNFHQHSYHITSLVSTVTNCPYLTCNRFNKLFGI